MAAGRCRGHGLPGSPSAGPGETPAPCSCWWLCLEGQEAAPTRSPGPGSVLLFTCLSGPSGAGGGVESHWLEAGGRSSRRHSAGTGPPPAALAWLSSLVQERAGRARVFTASSFRSQGTLAMTKSRCWEVPGGSCCRPSSGHLRFGPRPGLAVRGICEHFWSQAQNPGGGGRARLLLARAPPRGRGGAWRHVCRPVWGLRRCSLMDAQEGTGTERKQCKVHYWVVTTVARAPEDPLGGP